MASRLLLLAVFLSVTSPAAWAQDPAGAEFQVNSYTTNSQWVPSVASDTNGNFVVVWASQGQDGSGHHRIHLWRGHRQPLLRQHPDARR